MVESCASDVIAETRGATVLARLDQRAAVRNGPCADLPLPCVRVSVLGLPLALPEHALREGLWPLQLSTEGYVGLQDYAEAVAVTLGVLARNGIVVFPTSEPPAGFPPGWTAESLAEAAAFAAEERARQAAQQFAMLPIWAKFLRPLRWARG